MPARPSPQTPIPMSTPGDFKRLALSLAGAEEGSHMGAVDFRVGGRIFATLASVHKGDGNLMLTPEQQQAFVAERPDLFLPIAGKWGEGGATHLRLAEADEAIVRGALEAAWHRRVALNARVGPKKTPTRRRPRRPAR
jgi:phage tail tape-measure protein